MRGFEGRWCIVRTYNAGVFVGLVKSVDTTGMQCVAVVEQSRMIWRWAGANTCTELANGSIKRDEYTRITEVLKEDRLLPQVLEIIPIARNVEAESTFAPVWNDG